MKKIHENDLKLVSKFLAQFHDMTAEAKAGRIKEINALFPDATIEAEGFIIYDGQIGPDTKIRRVCIGNHFIGTIQSHLTK